MGDKKGSVSRIMSKLGGVSIPGTSGKYRKELEKAEEQYRAIFEHSGSGMLVIAPDLTIVAANHKASEICGYPLSMLEEGHAWTEFIPEVDLQRVLEYRKRRLAGETEGPLQYETAFRHADGTTRYLFFNVSEIPESDNILSSFIDISDLHETHRLLQESEERFKETAELLPVVICEFDRQMKFTYVNQMGYTIFDYPSEVVEQNRVSLTDFFVPDELPHLRASIERRWNDNDKEPEEYRMITRNGEIRNFLIISSLIHKNDEVVGLRSCLVDITTVHEVKRELVERERRLSTIFQYSPIGITTLDETGTPQEMNNAFRELFLIEPEAQLPSFFPVLSLSEDDLLEKTVSRIVGFRLVFNESAESYETIQFDSLAYSWHITPIHESGKRSYLCQVIDITEQYTRTQKRISEAEEMVKGLRKELTLQSSVEGIVTRNRALQSQLDTLPTIATTNTTLLITGESGTGKELMAKAVHQLSDRSDNPFVAINCGALPDSLLESELFGHVKGAFTDAKSDRKGKFLAADKGTIFLDEVGELSLQMQVKLLRVLQERSFEPVGSDKTISVDVRVIAATNRNLAEMVQAGTFREDLFYRIKVLHFQLPPLRDRREDLPLLCDHFIHRFNQRFNKSITSISTEALDLLLTFPFPGNIRELQNVLEHAFIFCNDTQIKPEHLPGELVGSTERDGGNDTISLHAIHSFDELERQFLLHMIKRHHGNKTETAKALDMHKATLFRKLRKLGITSDTE